MNEQRWAAGADPDKMLAYLRDRASDRKLRLFACACAGSAWRLLTARGCRDAVEASER